ncbi:hypothetical protein GCM10028821_14480 [Hymenobacter jeollabukensis]
MSAWGSQPTAQQYVLGQVLPAQLARKNELARELRLSRDRFRLLLRYMERRVPGFYTGRSRCLTPDQQVVIRQFYQQQLSTCGW